MRGEKLRVLVLCLALGVLAIHQFTLPLAQATPPAYVYLTWATDDMATTINVSWRADEDYLGQVLYDTQPRGGDPGAYRFSAQGEGGETTPKFEGYIHHVELTGLKPGTEYYFIAGHPDHGWSEELKFQTAPARRENIRFIVGGDSRSSFFFGYHPDWPRARDDVTKLAASFNPDFVVFLGDFLSNGEEQYGADTWDNWFGTWFKLARREDGSLIPLVPVIGNHEIYYPQPPDYSPSTHAMNYYLVFNLPGEERWYSLDWGPDLHLVVLDSEVLSTTSESWINQVIWLENDLKGHQAVPWRMVFFHRPVFSSGKYKLSELYRLEEWISLFDLYKVDLVFSAHDHGYERTGPINHTDRPQELLPSPENGRVYVVTAGWGAPLYAGGGTRSWFTAPDSPGRLGDAEDFYHVVVVDISPQGTLTMRAVRRDGEVMDSYSIQKRVEPLPAPFPLTLVGGAAAVIVAAGVGAYLIRGRKT